jgi:hypothetical protein
MNTAFTPHTAASTKQIPFGRPDSPVPTKQ